MSEKIYDVSAEWSKRAFVDAAKYREMYARSVSDPKSVDPFRRVLMLRLLRDFRIADAAALTARVEPVYDLNARLLDYSFAMYLNFRQDWLLGNIGRRVRVGQ